MGGRERKEGRVQGSDDRMGVDGQAVGCQLKVRDTVWCGMGLALDWINNKFELDPV